MRSEIHHPPNHAGGIRNGHGAALAVPPAPAVINPLLWTLEQAAAALNLSPRTLKRMDSTGSLPEGAVVRPFGRRRLFSRLILEEWVRKGCPQPVRRRR